MIYDRTVWCNQKDTSLISFHLKYVPNLEVWFPFRKFGVGFVAPPDTYARTSALVQHTVSISLQYIATRTPCRAVVARHYIRRRPLLKVCTVCRTSVELPPFPLRDRGSGKWRKRWIYVFRFLRTLVTHTVQAPRRQSNRLQTNSWGFLSPIWSYSPWRLSLWLRNLFAFSERPPFGHRGQCYQV